jgi:hypothetical protein
MGRQIQLHALEEDYAELLSWAKAKLNLVLTLWSTEQPAIEPIPQVPTGRDKYALLDRTSATTIARRRIDQNGGGVSFLIPDGSALELSPSLFALWDGKTVLLQGRIYTGFEYGDILNKQYASITNWIHRRWQKLPIDRLGFVGPQAWEWFQSGGTLMPAGFVPVENQIWRDYVAEFDACRGRAVTPNQL